MSTKNAVIKREDISSAIFDALSLYCVENDYFNAVKNLTPTNVKPVQDAVEKLLVDIGLDLK